MTPKPVSPPASKPVSPERPSPNAAELVSDPARREQLAARAYAHAAGRSWTVVLDRLLPDYRDVMRAAA